MIQRFRNSLSQVGIKHLVFTVFALLALIPGLALVRVCLLLALPERGTPTDTAQVVALAVFLILCQLAGLALLISYARRITALSVSSRQARERALAVAPETAGEAAVAQPPPPANEIETLTDVLSRLQGEIARNLGRLHSQATVLQQLDALLDQVDDMFLVTDARNVVLYANRAARQRLGVMPERPLRQAMAEGTIHPESQADWADALDSWVAREEERVFRPSEGAPMTLAVRILIHPPNGENRGKFIVLRDVGERKRLERQLYASEKLASLGQIISGVAHELNNPLAAVLGFAELSRDPGLARADLDHNLEVIEREAHRTAHIVENLLSFGRHRTPQRNPVSMHDVLNRCMELLGYLLKSRNVNVIRDFAPSLPPVTADEYQIQQVFMNILINAAQALEAAATPGPAITVRTRFPEGGRAVIVQVVDNGPGIPPENLRRVFDPFFTTKGPQDGTGLGLAVSMGIVKEHGGLITVQSPVQGEAGTGFTVYIPLALTATAETDTRVLARYNARAKLLGRVLVVDDEPGVLQMTRQALAGLGLEIDTRASFDAARAAVLQGEFDLYLVDFLMPDGTGAEFWQFLAAHRPRACERILFMSGDPHVEAQIARECGHGVPFLLKPFHVEDLREAVSVCLAGKQPAR